jgi:hypothetical protein
MCFVPVIIFVIYLLLIVTDQGSSIGGAIISSFGMSGAVIDNSNVGREGRLDVGRGVLSLLREASQLDDDVQLPSNCRISFWL